MNFLRKKIVYVFLPVSRRLFVFLERTRPFSVVFPRYRYFVADKIRVRSTGINYFSVEDTNFRRSDLYHRFGNKFGSFHGEIPLKIKLGLLRRLLIGEYKN